MSHGARVEVAGTVVRGVGVDGEARCVHYGSDRDVAAMAFPCCAGFYPCVRCHDAVADHEARSWPAPARAERAVLCGACGGRLALSTYFARLEGDASCPACGAAFNPGCLDHRERYLRG